MQTKLIAAVSGSALAAAALTALVLRPAPVSDVENGAANVAQAQPAGDAPGAVKQGIAVRGHWQIEVRNPDGTVASRNEFDNAFVDNANNLANILTHRRSVLWWGIYVGGSGLCLMGDPPDYGTICKSLEPGYPVNNPTANPHQFYNLVVTPGDRSIDFTGFVMPNSTGNLSVSSVSLRIHTCSTDASVNCPEFGNESSFTEHVITPGIPVVSGQQVLVHVVLQFAAAN